MEDGPSRIVDISQLRKGMFIQLDLGWMDHPFPLNSFKISTDDQIHTIVALGLRSVRYFPDRSDPEQAPAPSEFGNPTDPASAASVTPDSPERLARQQRAQQLASQNRSLLACERRFGEAARQYRRVSELLMQSPLAARYDSEQLVGSCVNELLGNGESVIRLLSESVGERSGQHPVNVMVLSLLLGQAMALEREALTHLGLAALLHDVGKLQLPDRVRIADESFSTVEYRAYQEHVAHSVALAQRMELPAEVTAGIAQHHETADGMGFPARLTGSQMNTCARVLSLVNRYDNFCNPARAAVAHTPHEALSILFAQMKPRFDATVLGAFIRMMGVYPPGSVVQLANERYAMVVSVNSSRPLRPRVIVYDPLVPRDEALLLDLEQVPEIGIRRSLKPAQLPKATLDYLSPRKRICYFFERAVEAGSGGGVM